MSGPPGGRMPPPKMQAAPPPPPPPPPEWVQDGTREKHRLKPPPPEPPPDEGHDFETGRRVLLLTNLLCDLAMEHGVYETVEAARAWVAYMDGQMETMARHATAKAIRDALA